MSSEETSATSKVWNGFDRAFLLETQTSVCSKHEDLPITVLASFLQFADRSRRHLATLKTEASRIQTRSSPCFMARISLDSLALFVSTSTSCAVSSICAAQPPLH